MSALSSPPSIFHTVTFHYGCPCPPKWRRRLTEIVNGQPEHVIGAHPCIVNVLQDETLMETHNGVFICLQTHTQMTKLLLIEASSSKVHI